MSSLEHIQSRRANDPPSKRFLPSGPFEHAKRYAAQHSCDVAVPNGSGIGNVIAYTPLVEALARELGRPLRLLTAPMDTLIGSSPVDGPYPIWENNPYVGDIVNADEIDPQIMVHLRAEQSNICQFGHIIENICLVYNLIPRAVKPSLFLTAREQSQALDLLAGSRRPVVGIHAGGTSSSPPGSLWFLDGWRELISKLDEEVSFFQIAKAGVDQKDLSIPAPDVSLRTSMALIWACDIFVGFDSSPAHIATAFDRPTAVLWDVRQKSLIEDRHYVGFAPASMLRWSYPQNRNLMILGEKDADLVDLCIEFVHKTVASFKHQR